HNANDGRRKIRANVTEPSGDGRSGASETAPPVRPGRTARGTATAGRAIKSLEAQIHPRVRAAERPPGGRLGVVAEHESPPTRAFGGEWVRVRISGWGRWAHCFCRVALHPKE